MAEERVQGVSEVESQVSEILQDHSADKQNITLLEKVAIGAIACVYTMLVATIFHLHQWHFYLHCLSSGLVAWQFWPLADAAPYRKDLLDEIIEYGVGSVVILSAWVSHLNGWLFWLYLLSIGIMGIGIGLLRLAFRGDFS